MPRNNFVFEEPEKDKYWTPEDGEAEYQRQYKAWMERQQEEKR